MVSRAFSTTLVGVDAELVEVEAQIFGSLRRFSIVGLPDGILKESKDRIRCAVENSGFRFPDREVIVSLGPAALPKTGSGFDLAIALSLLAADGQVDRSALKGLIFCGELALDGTVRPAAGALAAACFARSRKRFDIIVSVADAKTVSYVAGVNAYAVRSLNEAAAVLNGSTSVSPLEVASYAETVEVSSGDSFGDVVGQNAAKRALEIAAAGGHNVLMSGPPGAGKSMLATRFQQLLPPLSLDAAIEVTKIHARSGLLGNQQEKLLSRPPYRAPHHTTSFAGLVGGGSNPFPGEITLAHRGVLFLDELPEFRRDALETLRQPLESKYVVVSRARRREVFPADFILIAAMNPCPCGLRGNTAKTCGCTPSQIKRYQERLSGPMLDRIDIHLWVPAVPPAQLKTAGTTDPTPLMRQRINGARQLQTERFQSALKLNSHMAVRELRAYCELSVGSQRLLDTAAAKIDLTARAYNRTLKVARTIADLGGEVQIKEEHVAEALSYRLQND